MSDTTTCVYQSIYDESDSDDTKIIQYFMMHGMGLYIKVDSYVANMFYAWSLSYNTPVPVYIDKNKHFVSLNTYTTVFSWGAGNSNKNRMKKLDSLLW